MDSNLVFFDTVLLQQDLRVRLPKPLVKNLDADPGKAHLAVYFNAVTKEIVLKVENSNQEENQ